MSESLIRWVIVYIIWAVQMYCINVCSSLLTPTKKRPPPVYRWWFFFRAASWKSAAKQRLCGNLLTFSLPPPMEVRDPQAGGEQSSHPLTRLMESCQKSDSIIRFQIKPDGIKRVTLAIIFRISQFCIFQPGDFYHHAAIFRFHNLDALCCPAFHSIDQ